MTLRVTVTNDTDKPKVITVHRYGPLSKVFVMLPHTEYETDVTSEIGVRIDEFKHEELITNKYEDKQ